MASSHRFTLSVILIALTTFSSLATAQLILTSGNTQLPSCALQCTALKSASSACGGTDAATPTVWNCFCQSGYLTSLYNPPSNICDSFCTSASDNQAIVNWYKTNCGTDDGATEHTAAAAVASPSATASTSTSAVPSAGATVTATGSSTNSGFSTSDSTTGQSWVSTHYRWIIFIVVVGVGFIIITIVAIWLKRRYNRKRDQINGGFNAGVSDNVPPMRNAAFNGSGKVSTTGVNTGGVNSPARTREAFMPYGYNYSHSETRIASPGQVLDTDHRSHLARGGTPVNNAPAEDPDAIKPAKRQKRVLVRGNSSRGPETPPV